MAAETRSDAIDSQNQPFFYLQEKVTRLAQSTVVKSDATSGNDNVPSSSPQRSSSDTVRRYTIVEHGETEKQNNRPRTVP